MSESFCLAGVKQWHLRPEGDFYPKANFQCAVDSIPNGSEVLDSLRLGFFLWTNRSCVRLCCSWARSTAGRACCWPWRGKRELGWRRWSSLNSIHVRRDKYQSVEEAMRTTLQLFMQVLVALVKRKNFKVRVVAQSFFHLTLTLSLTLTSSSCTFTLFPRC